MSDSVRIVFFSEPMSGLWFGKNSSVHIVAELPDEIVHCERFETRADGT